MELRDILTKSWKFYFARSITHVVEPLLNGVFLKLLSIFTKE